VKLSERLVGRFVDKIADPRIRDQALEANHDIDEIKSKEIENSAWRR